jgi:hypothetical protein
MSNEPILASQDAAPTEEVMEIEGTPQVPPQGSFVKYAMRNMVRKKGTSLKHFALSTIGLLAFLVGVSYLTR